MKPLKSILQTLFGYVILAAVSSIFIFIFIFSIGLGLTFIKFIPNKHSIFYEVASINYLEFFSALLVSFMICLTVMVVYSFIFVLIRERLKPQTLSRINQLMLTVLTALFLTLTLIFWLDEKGFTIATSIISFFALLFPLSKRFWDSQNFE